MVEAGPHVRDDYAFVQPARCLNHLRPDNPIFRAHVSKTSEYLGGRSQIVTCASVVGGSSSVNCRLHRVYAAEYALRFLEVTIYNRAVASDFDDWETVYHNPGWGAKDIIPLLKKVGVDSPFLTSCTIY